MEFDKLFDNPDPVKAFSFDEAVAEVFDNMVERSVPFYNEIQRMVVELSARYVRPGGCVYDLGCSTATTLCLLGEAVSDPSVKLIGIDNSKPMLEKARTKLEQRRFADRIELRLLDLCEQVDLAGAGVVLMNWTLQFVDPGKRDALIQRIYNSLSLKGCFICCEKLVVADDSLNRDYIDFYHAFKRRKGYSNREIEKKREALNNVLVPYPEENNVEILRRNGFQSIDVFFRWYNWAGFIAIKDPKRSG